MDKPSDVIFTELTEGLREPDGHDLASLFDEYDRSQDELYGRLRERIAYPNDDTAVTAMTAATEAWSERFEACVRAIHELEADFDTRATVIAGMMTHNRQGRFDTLVAASDGRMRRQEMDLASMHLAVKQVLTKRAVNDSEVESVVSFQGFLMNTETADYLKVLGIF